MNRVTAWGVRSTNHFGARRLIYVDPDRAPVSGDDVVASITKTGEATFKRYIEEPGSGKMLKAINPA